MYQMDLFGIDEVPPPLECRVHAYVRARACLCVL
jgi:hypothetical protein